MVYHVPGTRRLIASVFALFLVALQYLPAQALWEVIGPRYRNVRGMDFIMTFEDPATILGLPTTPNTGYPDPSYTDIASAAAMWMCYTNAQTGQVNDQLSRVKEAGFNTVRVWLSWQVYQHAPTTMVNRFRVFLNACDMLQLYVIPILWDNDFFEPDVTSIQGANDVNYQKWIRAPGQSAIVANNGHLGTQHQQYVVDMVNTAMTSNNPDVVLLWDAMNEPDIRTESKQDTWILETLSIIKATDDGAKTCVTPAFWNHYVPEHVAVASQDSLDVLAFNFYGFGQRDIEQLCNNIRLVCASAGISETKPILVSEAGRIGEGMYYPDALNLLEKVPAQYTGNPNQTEDGVGFCLFSANVGQKWREPIENGQLTWVNFPIVEMGDGLFYAPNDDQGGLRRVRDYYPVGTQLVTRTLTDIVQVASNQGWSVTTPANIVQMPLNDPKYIPQFPHKLPDGTARPTLDGILTEAANVGTNSGLNQGSWYLVERERSIALWIYTYSFKPDYEYYHGIPDLLGDQDMLDLYNDWYNLAVMHAQNIGGNWATDPTFRATYQRLFGAVRSWWQAGGYDVRY